VVICEKPGYSSGIVGYLYIYISRKEGGREEDYVIPRKGVLEILGTLGD
jgi:hypothetical protein